MERQQLEWVSSSTSQISNGRVSDIAVHAGKVLRRRQLPERGGQRKRRLPRGLGRHELGAVLRCDRAGVASSSTVIDPAHPFSSSVYALTADSDGTLYAGGAFSDLGDIDAADRVAFLPSGGTWQPMGAGAGPCGCAVTSFVRGLAAVGTDVYVGSRGRDRDERPGHRTEYGVGHIHFDGRLDSGSGTYAETFAVDGTPSTP